MNSARVVVKKCASVSSGSFKNNDRISEVVIKEGVVSIEKEAFAGCKNLKRVFIPQSVNLIDASAFQGSGVLLKIANQNKDGYTSIRIIMICCKKNSYADKWFKAKKTNYIIVYC